jgi:hypothetical protein
LNFTYYGVPCQEPFSCDHLAPYWPSSITFINLSAFSLIKISKGM